MDKEAHPVEMEEEGHKVSLNVYDLSQGLARQLSTTFLGKAIEAIWHTGVVVYGNEYYFGGGIQHSPAGTTPYGTPMRVVDLGVTHDISPRYAAETYSLLTHNCNNFSNEVAQFLVGATIPDYILNLPNEVMSSPMVPMIQQLETTLRAGAVPQVPQFRPPTQAQTPQPTSTVGKSVASGSKSSTTKVNLKESGSKVKSEEQLAKFGESKKTDNTVSQLKSSVNDPIGNARNKVQEEICAEFTAIMASGTLRASEAAALATRRVMQRHGYANTAQS
ncbi:hypothetical protein CsSME_00041554 [Camellia sinensis var. sinensis]